MHGTAQGLDITQFFCGRLVAHGFFQDRFGRIRRRFRADMIGAFEDGRDGAENTRAFVLHEDFTYDDGERLVRDWRIVPGEGGDFIATAGDVIGPAAGRSSPDGWSMAYLHALVIDGRPITLRFHDTITRLDAVTAISRTQVTKFGIAVGDVSIVFQREQPMASDATALLNVSAEVSPATWQDVPLDRQATAA